MNTYTTTFYFYYPDAKSARKEYKFMFVDFGEKISEPRKITGDHKPFWMITLVMDDLAAKQIRIHDIALGIKFRGYDGWDIDTRDPIATIKDLGYDIDPPNLDELSLDRILKRGPKGCDPPKN